MKLINIGFGNIVSANRLVAIVSPESAPIKRIIQEARDRGMAHRCHIWQKNKSCNNYRQRPYNFISGTAGNRCAQTECKRCRCQ